VVGWVKESLGEDTVQDALASQIEAQKAPAQHCWHALVIYSARFINQRRNTMSEKKTASIVIDDVEYTEDDLTDEQKIVINHLMDLDRKINSTQFNLAQLQVGRDAFMGMLKQSLEAPVETADD
jgi:hypothetical protein